MTKILLSIIIPTKDEELNIGRLLNSIITSKQYNKETIEIIVVDNPGTTDKTRDIVDQFPIVQLFLQGPERSSQRNYGAKMANGEYLYFVDADMEFSTNLLSEILLNLNKEDILVIPEQIPGNSLYCKAINIEKSIYNENPIICAARVFTKSKFLEVGGYDINMISGEDWELDKRLKKIGCKVKFIQSLDNFMTNIFLFRNCFNGAVSGGDMHTADIFGYLDKNQGQVFDVNLFLIHPKGDNHLQRYPQLSNLNNLEFKAPNYTDNFAVLYLLRAIYCLIFLSLKPYTKAKNLPNHGGLNIFVASSHFIPDVLPTIIKSLFVPNRKRAVYIHHIIQEMNRPKNLNNTLANIQEQVCFFLIKRFYDKIFVINTDVKEYLIKNGFKQELLLVSCPVVTPKLDTQTKLYDMVFCGRFVKQKGIYDFLKAFELVQKTKNNLKAVMIGSGPEFTAIEELIQKNNLNIELTGYIETQQKFEIVAKSKIFVFPSFEEGWGIAIGEAMQIGILVIAYNLKVYQEVFKGNILTTPIGDINQLANRVISELNKIDTDSQQDYIAKSKIFANQFDVEIIANQEYKFLTN